MPYLLDTNIAIYLRDGNPEIVARLRKLDDAPAMSLVTLIELEGGVYAKPALADRRRARVDTMLLEMRILSMTTAVVRRYGEIVRAMGYSRAQLIDRLIAATAMHHELTLITINGADFKNIPDLSLEIWPAPAAQ
jgi:tRNA(fMet)-specific endonuclease VapC